MDRKTTIITWQKFIIVLTFLIGQSVSAQETDIQISTMSKDAAVYSANGFLGSTEFKESVNFGMVKELYVVGDDGIFELIRDEDFSGKTEIDVSPFPLETLAGQHKSVKLGKVQILTEKLEPSAPNAYVHNAIYDEDNLNKEFKNFINEYGLSDGSNDTQYSLSGVVEKDIVFWDGFNPNKHKCLFVDVKWTLRANENSATLYEKTTKGGHYFGTKFKPKNQADVVETTAYAYRKAVLSSLLQFLRLEQMTNKEYENQLTASKDSEETLVISSGTNFCSEISGCAQASVTVETQKSTGSGFFISNNGYILTNHHVVQNEEQPTIILQNGISIPVSVVRSNENYDVALLKASINSVTAIQLSNDSLVTNGDDVFAIGSPKGAALSQTTSRGIVSAYRKGKKPMIQTDVSVNSGNSGGPLLNSKNEVIGIITSKIIEEGVEGIAFAIPINEALNALNLKLE